MKMREMKTKNYLDTLIVLWIKWRNKTFYRCRFNYSLSKLNLDNEMEDLLRKENPDSSKFNRYDRSSVTRSRISRVYTDIKIAINAKVNRIMVSFTNHYNAVFIDRFPSKTKIGKDSLYFNNSLLCNPKFFLTIKTFLFLLKTQNTTTLQKVNSEKTINLVLKKMLGIF